ncbi:Uma2 family endonuclease [Leptothoe kymatousa]|uniref:Uma2 family endonuclease n=1 Tax=Leptothoe kymatousa TAU-MAC 1615 TaxID=2364775 RepID=A0ABS5Y006_9CYAN|nr:Uma2 family endonuclease [Leptothoe kymatousa]MBT9311187.1 Uma2 family endonuclease [Leptothoe kymatousa TAU-MAC 1615]
MTATLIQSPDRVVLQNISWQSYQSLIHDFAQEPAIRLTYDHGTLEIRMPLDPHESFKKLIGRLIEAATEELDLEIRSLGSRTCDREDLASGLEPDQCYYIQNEPQVRGVEQIDLTQLPPPDLAVEIDITSSSLNRFAIYQALGVPEIWRYNGNRLEIYLLQGDEYVVETNSRALSWLTAADISRFLTIHQTMGENALVKQFRQWIRTTN